MTSEEEQKYKHESFQGGPPYGTYGFATASNVDQSHNDLGPGYEHGASVHGTYGHGALQHFQGMGGIVSSNGHDQLTRKLTFDDYNAKIMDAVRAEASFYCECGGKVTPEWFDMAMSRAQQRVDNMLRHEEMDGILQQERHLASAQSQTTYGIMGLYNESMRNNATETTRRVAALQQQRPARNLSPATPQLFSNPKTPGNIRDRVEMEVPEPAQLFRNEGPSVTFEQGNKTKLPPTSSFDRTQGNVGRPLPAIFQSETRSRVSESYLKTSMANNEPSPPFSDPKTSRFHESGSYLDTSQTKKEPLRPFPVPKTPAGTRDRHESVASAGKAKSIPGFSPVCLSATHASTEVHHDDDIPVETGVIEQKKYEGVRPIHLFGNGKPMGQLAEQTASTAGQNDLGSRRKVLFSSVENTKRGLVTFKAREKTHLLLRKNEDDIDLQNCFAGHGLSVGSPSWKTTSERPTSTSMSPIAHRSSNSPRSHALAATLDAAESLHENHTPPIRIKGRYFASNSQTYVSKSAFRFASSKYVTSSFSPSKKTTSPLLPSASIGAGNNQKMRSPDADAPVDTPGPAASIGSNFAKGHYMLEVWNSATVQCAVDLSKDICIKPTGPSGDSALSDSICTMHDGTIIGAMKGKPDQADYWCILLCFDNCKPVIGPLDPTGIELESTRGNIVALQSVGRHLCVMMKNHVNVYRRRDGRFIWVSSIAVDEGIHTPMSPHGIFIALGSNGLYSFHCEDRKVELWKKFDRCINASAQIDRTLESGSATLVAGGPAGEIILTIARTQKRRIYYTKQDGDGQCQFTAVSFGTFHMLGEIGFLLTFLFCGFAL